MRTFLVIPAIWSVLAFGFAVLMGWVLADMIEYEPPVDDDDYWMI